MYWYLKVMKNYVNFEGRARRTEYWMFVLVNAIISIALAIMDNILGITYYDEVYGPLVSIYNLIVFLPYVSVKVRRLHDIGKSGWMVLISLIPLIGTLWLFVLTVMDGDYGDNEYGPDPKSSEYN